MLHAATESAGKRIPVRCNFADFAVRQSVMVFRAKNNICNRQVELKRTLSLNRSRHSTHEVDFPIVFFRGKNEALATFSKGVTVN